MDKPADLDALAQAARSGLALSAEFLQSSGVQEGSLCDSLIRLAQEREACRAKDGAFLERALRGYVAMAGTHVGAVGAQFALGRQVTLHPLATSVRAISEASGRVWWLLEPWIDDTQLGRPMDPEEVEAGLSRTFARSQLLQLEILALRLKRARARDRGKETQRVVDASAQLEAERKELNETLAGSTESSDMLAFKVSGSGTKAWHIAGERLPALTDLVHASNEYAYGQGTRGTGRNPYPLFSGFAHAGLDTISVERDGVWATEPGLFVADEVEIRLLAGLAVRTFAAAYEMAASAFGQPITELKAWEDLVDPLVWTGELST